MQVAFASAMEGQLAWDALGLLCIPAIVALNGLFVAAEFALVSLRKTRVEEMVSQGVKGAKAVDNAVHNLTRSIAATQLGITFTSIALGWIAEPVLCDLLEPLFDFLPESWGRMASHTAATVTAFMMVTFLHVVFGELIPKRMALQKPDQGALWLALPLNAFARLTRPLILLMTGTANIILRRFGFDPAGAPELVHSVEELALLVEDTEEAGLIDEDQAEFVQNVFRLSDKQVKDCMVGREKMATLELSSPPEVVLEKVRGGAHTRLPVYDGDPDKIVGIVNTKDLFYLFSVKGVVILEDALYPALYLKPDESMATALRLFRQARRPMALVRDEEYKIQGLITLEDVLEEIVGELEDEHDRPTPKLVLRRKRTVPRSAPSSSSVIKKP